MPTVKEKQQAYKEIAEKLERKMNVKGEARGGSGRRDLAERKGIVISKLLLKLRCASAI